VTSCDADCTGKVCGDDGCGGSCGTCADGEACGGGQCVFLLCTPDCTGKVCGDDGCGGSCGTCLDGDRIGGVIRASPFGNYVARIFREFLPEPGQEQSAEPPLMLAAFWMLLILILILPLLLAILFAFLLCNRRVNQAPVRFLLAQLVLLGSLLVILFIIFSSSPWLLQAVRPLTVVIILIVLLLEEFVLLVYVVTQHCEKCYVLLHTSVEHYDQWKDAFDEFEHKRDNAGSKGGFVFRNVDDANQVTILLKFANLKKARAFVNSDELRDAMQRSGVKGPPNAFILEKDDRPSVCYEKMPIPYHVLLQISVEDYDDWMATFDEFRLEIQAAGSEGRLVFRDADDANQVTVLLEIDNLGVWQLADSDVLREAMQRSGVKGPPNVYYLEETDRPSA
jgi:heme-degrading monooxygenase HmoA